MRLRRKSNDLFEFISQHLLFVDAPIVCGVLCWILAFYRIPTLVHLLQLQQNQTVKVEFREKQ